VLAGHPIGGAFEVGVSLAAVPAFAKQELLAILGQIGNGFLLDRVPGLSARPVDNRAYGNPDDGRRATAPVLAFSQPMTAATGADERFEEKRDQIVGIVIRLKNDVATVAAITAIRPAMRDEFFAAEAAASVASVSCLGVNANLVNKSHDVVRVLEIGGRVE